MFKKSKKDKVCLWRKVDTDDISDFEGKDFQKKWISQGNVEEVDFCVSKYKVNSIEEISFNDFQRMSSKYSKLKVKKSWEKSVESCNNKKYLYVKIQIIS